MGCTALPPTDGHPFRKSILMRKVPIWAATWEEADSLGHPGAQPGRAKRLAASFPGTAVSLRAHARVFLVTVSICQPLGTRRAWRGPLRPSPPVCNLSFREDPIPFLCPPTTNPSSRPRSEEKLIKECLLLAPPGLGDSLGLPGVSENRCGNGASERAGLVPPSLRGRLNPPNTGSYRTALGPALLRGAPV